MPEAIEAQDPLQNKGNAIVDKFNFPKMENFSNIIRYQPMPNVISTGLNQPELEASRFFLAQDRRSAPPV